MRARILCIGAVGALGIAAMGTLATIGLAVPAQEGSVDAKKAPGPQDLEAMMKEMEALARPGPQHRKLQEMAGTWDAVLKSWCMGPTSPPLSSKGTQVNRAILGGRFILQEFEGAMAMPSPSGGTKEMPYQGQGLMGYDNFRNVFVGTWVDSMGTGIMSFTGSLDPAGKELNTYGAMDQPVQKVIGGMVRLRTRFIDRDHHVLEMYDVTAGPESKAMEISYTRRK